MPLGTIYDLPAFFREKVTSVFSASVQQEHQKFGNVGIVAPDWTTDQYLYWEREPVVLRDITGQRGGKTPRGEFKASRRSAHKVQFQGAMTFDRRDTKRLEMATLPQSETNQDFMSAWNRQVDLQKIKAAGRQALTVTPGSNATTAVALPSHMTVAVDFQKLAGSSGSNTGFTIFKMAEAIRQLEDLNVDLDRKSLTLAISPRMKQNWIVYSQSAVNDLWAKMLGIWLSDPGKTLMGANVIVTTQLLEVSTGIDEALLFTNDAFIMSDAAVEVKYDTLVDDNHAHQLTFYGEMGVERYKDEYVKRILSDRNGAMLN